MQATTIDALRESVGIGLRQPHYREIAEAPPALGFLEVHSENFFADGGAALAVLDGLRERHAISLHGVGLALGSAVGIDEWHLERLARLADRISRSNLTAREVEILGVLARGLTNKEIGQVFSISENTVRNHVNSIIEKLEVTDRTEAATTALLRGIIHIDH